MKHALALSIPLLLASLGAACDESPEEAPAPPPPAAEAEPAPPPRPSLPAVPTLPTTPTDLGATVVEAIAASVAEPHRIRATMTGDPRGPSSFVAEFVPPDRARITMALAPGREMQVVHIGETVWSNVMGRWMRTPAGAMGASGPPNPSQFTSRLREAVAAGRVTFRSLGPEAVDGVPATVYEGTGPMDLYGGTETGEGTGRLWIGENRRLLRVTSEATARGAPTSVDMRYEYGESITIEPPAP